MAQEALLELAVDLASEMQCTGAETYRVEDTVRHLTKAYDTECEVFVIPNCIIVSAKTSDGRQLNRMRRPKGGSTDIHALERFNELSRDLCREKPPVEEARRRFEETKQTLRSYPSWVTPLGNFLAGGGFALFFGGSFLDILTGGLAGIVVGLCNWILDKFQVNVFFKAVASCFLMTLVAYTCSALGFSDCLDATIMGPMMLVVPGLLFTNSLRDIIYGDSLSGVNRLVQVIIIAAAIAVGTAAGSSGFQSVFGKVVAVEPYTHGLLVQCIAGVVGSTGFGLLFNYRGKGFLLCLVGSIISWTVYYICAEQGLSEAMCMLVAALASAIYAEIMARVRHCPAIGYLLVAIIPLIPGSAVYYTASYALAGDAGMFGAAVRRTAALAGALAVGILLISTISRMWVTIKQRKRRRN